MGRNIVIQKRGQFKKHSSGKVPSKNDVFFFIDELVGYLFPILSENQNLDQEKDIMEILGLLKKILQSYDSELPDINFTINKFKETLPEIYELLVEDAIAIYEGDPAATCIEEVIISYPGFYAILIYRIAHQLDNLDISAIPRMLTEYSHGKTGIDIHPKAKIGKSFFIDHGTGIVIGESTVIGNSVKIYQGVTLGALSVSKNNAGIKRHPTIEDNVIIYAQAVILGGSTVIGKNSIVGGNTWVTQSIPSNSFVYNKSEVKIRSKDNSFETLEYII